MRILATDTTLDASSASLIDTIDASVLGSDTHTIGPGHAAACHLLTPPSPAGAPA